MNDSEFKKQAEIAMQKASCNVRVEIDYKNQKIILRPDSWQNHE